MVSSMKTAILLIILFAGCTGFLGGYYDASGEMPRWFAESRYILPEMLDSGQTIEDVAEFIEEDKTNENEEYLEGFNCVDYTMAVQRASQWQGLISVIVLVEYDEIPHHAVLGFPTVDKGFVFYETQTDKEVDLAVGKIYNGRRIVDLKIMTVVWVPLDEWTLPEGSE